MSWHYPTFTGMNSAGFFLAMSTTCAYRALVLAAEELRLRVAGTSMAPAVWPENVLLSPRDGAARHEILFGRGGRLFAHRLVRRG
jgi:hypothetical protein